MPPCRHTFFRSILLLLALVSPSFSADGPGPAAATNRYLVDLPTVLQLADDRNLDVQIARQVLAEAQAQRNAALEQFFPWITPGIQFRRHDGLAQAVPSGVVSEGHFQSYAPGASVVAQVAIGEAIYNSLAARQHQQASGEALEAQRQQAATLAAHKYMDLVRAAALVEVNREAARLSRLYQDQLHAAVRAGIAFRGDELRVQTQTERFQISLRQSIERERTAAALLAQVLHLDPTVELFTEESGLALFTLIPDSTPLDVLVQQALQARPELAERAALVEAARQTNKGAIYGPLIPVLSAQYYGGGFGGAPDNLPDSFGTAQDFSATLGWRIGPGGLLDFARRDAAGARLKAAQLRLERSKDEVLREVVESHTLVQSLGDQIPAARENLATATESLRLAHERKEFGVGVVLEEIQAQQELVRARSDYLTAVAEYNKAQFALKRAVGGPASPHVKSSMTGRTSMTH